MSLALYHGGPLDGIEARAEGSAGTIVADKPNGFAWKYKRGADGGMYVESEDPIALDDELAEVAALGDEYDVIALPDDPEAEGVTDDGE